MRLDRYLAGARMLKSRSLAKTAADRGLVHVNAVQAKPAQAIRPGDIIEIDIPRFYKKIKVIALPAKNMKKSACSTLYELLELRPKELI